MRGKLPHARRFHDATRANKKTAPCWGRLGARGSRVEDYGPQVEVGLHDVRIPNFANAALIATAFVV